MTTFEHALLGINGAIACDLHHRTAGWKWVATAGLAAIAPDWDGLPMLVDMQRFEVGHRVWGHNLLACAILALILVVLVVHWDLWERLLGCHKSLKRFSSPIRVHTPAQWTAWWLLAFVAALSQVPADMVVSGGKGLTNWPLKPLWPFSDWAVVYPMVPWGNVGVTLIFAAGMIAMAKQSQRTEGSRLPGKKTMSLRAIAVITLVTVAGYITVWGIVFARPGGV